MAPVSNPWRLAAVGAFLACVVLAVLLCVVVAPVAPPVVWSVGEQQERAVAGPRLVEASLAPDFALATVAGDSVRLAALHGRQVALVFISSDCTYCERLVEKLAGLEQATADRILLVCAGPRAAARRFEQTHELSCPVLVDSTAVVQQAYQVQGVPTVCVIDAQGRVAASGRGLSASWGLLQTLEPGSPGLDPVKE